MMSSSPTSFSAYTSSIPDTASGTSITTTALTPRDPNTSSPTKTKASSSASAVSQAIAGAEEEDMMKAEKSYDGDEDVTKSGAEVGGGQNQNLSQSMDFHRKVLEKRLGEQGYVFRSGFFFLSFSLSFLFFLFFFCGSGGDKHRREARLMNHHRGQKAYISPSDTIMSPCTAKLSAYKSKHFLK